jgi:hypothetical protein
MVQTTIEKDGEVLPASYIPTPTQGYYAHRARTSAVSAETALPTPTPEAIPPKMPAAPISKGARVLMWKQDPSVEEIGIRKAYLPRRVFAGPRDARIAIQGVPTVTPNVFGDFIVNPPDTEAFDAVHTFAVVRQVLTMYERQRAPSVIPWQWNGGGNVDPLNVFPRAGVTQNAFYSRSQQALKFFFFDTASPPPVHTVFTCRSLDIVAHETGHAILDGLKPGWLGAGNVPQTGALHESISDLTAIFLTLSQFDQVEAIIAQTKANLHEKSFLSDLAEQFGLSLGRPNGLRNADNDLKLSQVSNQVHELSQVFTGGVFDVLADVFAFEQRPRRKDDAAVLYSVARYMSGLVIRAVATAPDVGATFADVVNRMLALTTADGKPPKYRQFIVDRFSFREVIAPFAGEFAADEEVEVEPAIQDEPGTVQDRTGCCGTMQLEEYLTEEDDLYLDLEHEVRDLRAALEAGDYDEMNVGQLRKLAAERGIEGRSEMSKAELVRGLVTSDREDDAL